MAKNSSYISRGFTCISKTTASLLFVGMSFSGLVFSSCESNDEVMEVKILEEKDFPEREITQLRAAQDQGCWCTQYIKNRLGYPKAKSGNAKNMGPWLSTIGWYEVTDISLDNLPKNKDIILFTPGAHGMTNSAGHVGIIASSYRNGEKIGVRVVGANQSKKGRTEKTEYNCTNVSIMEIPDLNMDHVSFWRKNPQ